MGALRPFDRELFFDTATHLTRLLWNVAAHLRDEVTFISSEVGEAYEDDKARNKQLWCTEHGRDIQVLCRRLAVLLDEGDVGLLACPWRDLQDLGYVWRRVSVIPADVVSADPQVLWELGHAIACGVRSMKDGQRFPQSTYEPGKITFVGMNGTTHEMLVRAGDERTLVEAIVDHGPLTYTQLSDGFGLKNPKITLDRLHERDSQFSGMFPDPTRRDDRLYTTSIGRVGGEPCKPLVNGEQQTPAKATRKRVTKAPRPKKVAAAKPDPFGWSPEGPASSKPRSTKKPSRKQKRKN